MRWHKVNDKKPETYPDECKCVIVWTEDTWYEGSWNGKYWYLMDTGIIEDVTHWAEVEPPTEGNTITE